MIGACECNLFDYFTGNGGSLHGWVVVGIGLGNEGEIDIFAVMFGTVGHEPALDEIPLLKFGATTIIIIIKIILIYLVFTFVS